MKGLLENQVAVITGAGSGVGRATAIVFAAHGAKVVCADINEGTARETVAMVEKGGGKAVAVACDVTSEESVTAALEGAVSSFGRLDVMFNNAGVGSPTGATPVSAAKLTDMTPKQIDTLQLINIQGVVNGCRAAVRIFERQGGGGAIVNTASVSGLLGMGGVYYCATKGAVVQLTRALAMEVAGQGTRVNCVAPGFMKTNFGAMSTLSGDVLEGTKRVHPLGRLIDPSDTANAVLFLASDLASNITGVILPVDGGITAGRK